MAKLNRQLIRETIENARDSAEPLPRDKLVKAKQVFRQGDSLVVDLGRGRICVVELEHSGNGPHGIGEFGLNVTGRVLLGWLGAEGKLSQEEVNEAWAMIDEHEKHTKENHELSTLLALAHKLGYLCTKED